MINKCNRIKVNTHQFCNKTNVNKYNMEQSRIPQWNAKTKISIECYQTFSTQIELLPRVSIVYGFGKAVEVKTSEGNTEIIRNGIAIEFLWFSMFITRKNIVKLNT